MKTSVTVRFGDADRRVAKDVARYTPRGSDAEHCGNCDNFIRPDSCARVTGMVVRGGWCKFWSKR